MIVLACNALRRCVGTRNSGWGCKPSPTNHRPRCHGHQSEVASESPLADIIDVHGGFAGKDLFNVGDFGVCGSGEDLGLITELDARGIRDSGANGQDLRSKLVGPSLDIPRHLRPRSHNAHLAAEYIDELGKLIHFGFPKDVAHAGDPRISIRADLQAGNTVSHRAELEDLERYAVPPHSLLPEEHRAAISQKNRGAGCKKDRSGYEEPCSRASDVERTLRTISAGDGHLQTSETASITRSTSSPVIAEEAGRLRTRSNSAEATGKSSTR